jgi:hypothetical protein
LLRRLSSFRLRLSFHSKMLGTNTSVNVCSNGTKNATSVAVLFDGEALIRSVGVQCWAERSAYLLLT